MAETGCRGRILGGLLKAFIINENCMGCGVCIVGCKQRALTYDLVRPPEYLRCTQPRTGPIGIMCNCTEVDR